MLNKRKKNHYKGLTILETIIAIFIITIGVLSIFAAINYNLSTVSYNSNRFIAIYLAQEGIEIIRNIRDNNFLNDNDWRLGLVDICPSSSLNWCEVDYNDNSVTVKDRYLKINSNGFYNYDVGTQTIFKRKIYIDRTTLAGKNVLDVKAKVEWEEKGKQHQFEIREYLYGWHYEP